MLATASLSLQNHLNAIDPLHMMRKRESM